MSISHLINISKVLFLKSVQNIPTNGLTARYYFHKFLEIILTSLGYLNQKIWIKQIKTEKEFLDDVIADVSDFPFSDFFPINS